MRRQFVVTLLASMLLGGVAVAQTTMTPTSPGPGSEPGRFNSCKNNCHADGAAGKIHDYELLQSRRL